MPGVTALQWHYSNLSYSESKFWQEVVSVRKYPKLLKNFKVGTKTYFKISEGF